MPYPRQCAAGRRDDPSRREKMTVVATALDTACGVYLNDPTAWIRPPTNLRAIPLSLAFKCATSAEGEVVV